MPIDLPPRWMFVKAALFAVLALLAGGWLFAQHPGWTTAACLAALCWSVCRAYYFLFHALQHWIDPTRRYRGLVDLLQGLGRRRPRA